MKRALLFALALGLTGCGALTVASGLAATFKVVREARVTFCNPKLDVFFDGAADASAPTDASARDAAEADAAEGGAP